MRIALIVAYNGNAFFGSQQQTKTSQTVLGVLIDIFYKLGITQKPVASGRTDRGVHASSQVIHIDLPPHWSDLAKLKQTLNTMAPSTLKVRKILPVANSFHARYSATMRTYRYIFKQGKSNPFQSDFVTFIPTLDTKKIAHNIKLFEGEHDFSSFMKSGSQTTSTIRTIYKTALHNHQGYTILTFCANGFLRSQVRMMVGALLNLDTQEITQKLHGKHQTSLKPAASNGLYLTHVSYPHKILLLG